MRNLNTTSMIIPSNTGFILTDWLKNIFVISTVILISCATDKYFFFQITAFMLYEQCGLLLSLYLYIWCFTVSTSYSSGSNVPTVPVVKQIMSSHEQMKPRNYFNKKMVIPCIGFPIIRQNRLTFMFGIPALIKQHIRIVTVSSGFQIKFQI